MITAVSRMVGTPQVMDFLNAHFLPYLVIFFPPCVCHFFHIDMIMKIEKPFCVNVNL